jgi:RHS repeat-associated protein
MERAKRVTLLPADPSNEALPPPPNPARDMQNFVGEVMTVASKPAELANLGVAKATNWLSNALPSFPAARLFMDLVLGWPHSHPHPPTFGFPLPSIGPVICAGAVNVLINGLPAVRTGDVGFGVWCGGYYPLFEVFTGSSNVFIGGARPARFLIDFTKHCLPGIPGLKGVKAAKKGFKGLSKFDKAMMALPVALGALGGAAALVDQAGYQEMADSAESESDAKEAAAKSEAAGIEAAMAGLQMAADLAAMALSIGMGKDPGFTPLNCWGKFITGSQNVLIGGLPMPGWDVILRGLGKLLKRRALKIAQRMGLNDGCGKLLEPIDVVTGANVDDFIDFTLPAPRLVWRRWYNSQQQEQVGPLGWGFRHEYQHELTCNRSTSQYTYTDQEGNNVPFPPFATDHPSERVVQSGYALRRLSEQRFELTAHNKPAIEFEFREMTGPARLVALRDEDRNFSFAYDGRERLIEIQIDEQRTVRLNYSSAGLVSEVSLERPGHEVIHVARYRYNDDGCLIEFRDGLDQVARYEYDPARRMTRKTDRRGYSYSYRYDERGRCVYTSGEDGMYEGWLEYHPEDRATAVKYSDGGSWLYEYNELGTITKIVDPYGGTQRRLVDPATGIVTRELDPAGNPTELLYNGQGAHTGRRDAWGYWAPPLGVEPRPADPLEHIVPETPLEWEFGNLLDRAFIGATSPDDPLLEGFPEVASEIAQSRPPGSGRNGKPASQEKHDLLGRLIERRNADGSVERWEYDAEGNETLYVDGDGGMHRKEYTSWNLLSREIDPAGNSCASQYSPSEEITRFVDAGGAVHEFVYDKKDRLVEVRRDGEPYDIYRYDEADNLIEKLDGKGRRLLVCEPGYGRLALARRLADGEGCRYEYNDRGRIVKAQTRRDRVALDYDEEGRSTREERNELGVKNEFDRDELVSITVFGTFITRYRREYDGRLIITDPTGSIHTFDFSDDGLILKELASGTRELVQYDSEGRCLRKVVESASGGRHARVYRYSAAGDLLRIEDNRRGGVKYHYDAAHRLKVAEREDGRNELYAHDAAGNLMVQPGLDGVRVGPGNKLKQANGERFHYDHRDNVVLRESEKGMARCEYDSFDQLVRMSLDGREWRAEYDALGRRTRKRWSGQTTEYYWDQDRLVGEISGGGSVRVYVYADERALAPFLYVDYASLNAEPETGKVRYVFTNHLGAPEQVEDESGRAVWRGEVSPYGAIQVEIGRRDEINIRFPGHYYDVETGLHYNRFRYYDPALGCYLQSDPLGIAGGSNLYAYLANPLTDVDILGLTARHTRGGGKPKGEAGAEGPVRPARQRSPKNRNKDAGQSAQRPPRRARKQDIQENPERYVEMRADEIRHIRGRNSGFETFNVAIVQKKGRPETRRVVITSSTDDRTVPRDVKLRNGETFTNPDPPRQTMRDPETGKRKVMPREEGDTRHHAEQRGKKSIADDEEIVAMAPTRGCCPGCQGALGDDLSKVPEHRRSPEAYNRHRREQRRAAREEG